MDRICFHYSIFSSDNVDNSLSYILRMCDNIDTYKRSGLEKKNVFLKIHTDDFTLRVIKDILKQERMDDSGIIYRIHRRNSGLNGMFWRFEAFFDNDSDIAVSAEGDYPIEKYFAEIEYLQDRPQFCLLVFETRQFLKNRHCFAAGTMIIRPKTIEPETQEKIKGVIALMEHCVSVPYGIDENFVSELFKTRFKQKPLCVIVHDRSRIFDHIEDGRKEMEIIQNYFPNSGTILYSNFTERLGALKKYSVGNKSGFFDRVKRSGQYVLNGERHMLKGVFRVGVDEFYEKTLTPMFKNIISDFPV